MSCNRTFAQYLLLVFVSCLYSCHQRFISLCRAHCLLPVLLSFWLSLFRFRSVFPAVFRSCFLYVSPSLYIAVFRLLFLSVCRSVFRHSGRSSSNHFVVVAVFRMLCRCLVTYVFCYACVCVRCFVRSFLQLFCTFGSWGCWFFRYFVCLVIVFFHSCFCMSYFIWFVRSVLLSFFLYVIISSAR